MTAAGSTDNEKPTDLASEMKALCDLLEDQGRTIRSQIDHSQNLECRLTQEMRKSRAARTALKKVRIRLKHVTGVADDLLAANKQLVRERPLPLAGHGD